MNAMLPSPVLEVLASNAESADRRSDWPQTSWEALRSSAWLGAAIPEEFGGSGRDVVALLKGNEALGSACLTTTFILSQRDAAIRLLLNSPAPLRQKYLPRLARGDSYLTVGLSQLTTSRSRGNALHAIPTQTGVRFEGEIPWVTGADHAEAIVIGASLEDGRQVLAVMPTDRKGVEIQTPLALSALQGSRTSVVVCDGVEIEADLILAGPAPQVMGRSVGGGLDTSCLAIALAASASTYLDREATSRPELTNFAERARTQVDMLRNRLHEQAGLPVDPEAVMKLRIESTKIALRATQAGLAAAKGAGFLAGHATQRWARQALFFLVWSCPRSVAEGVLADLLP